jgi:hypothetical protein
MKFKNLVTLGDSWVYGDELGQDNYRVRHGWPYLVASKFGLTLENLAFNGESLQSSIWSILWWLENHYTPDSLIILGMTNSWRTSWFRASHANDVNPWSAHINIVAPFDEPQYHLLKKIHIDCSTCDELHRFNRKQAVLFFEGLSRNQNLQVLLFDLYPDQHNVYGSNHMYPGQNATDWVGHHTKPLGHPDETGHIIIAEKLISWIESAILE